MGLLDISHLMLRQDIPEDVKKEMLVQKQHGDYLKKKIKQLEESNTRLVDILRVRNKEKESILNQLSLNKKTGLPNHIRIDSDLVRYIEELNKEQSKEKVGIIITKLDQNYDIATKTLKSSVSEWIIYQIGYRIIDKAGPNSFVYHTRDDEFIIIHRNLDMSLLDEIAQDIIKAVTQAHRFSGYHISIGCSVGISIFPDHGVNKEILLNNADIALNRANELNRSYMIYDESMREQVIEKMELQNSIIKALESQAINEINKQFELHFQPLVSISGIKGNQLIIDSINAEALIRWNHPSKGQISPLKFIPVAEETGLIIPIGNWVFYRALDQIAEWQQSLMKEVSIAVNLSSRQFKSHDIVDTLLRILEQKEIRPEMIKIEITESCVMDDPIDSIRKIKMLSEKGVQFSIDDFGTGYSSLSYLRRLPIHTLKIDKSFINHLSTNTHDRAIVKAIITMCREMNFGVVAEGIETKEQLEILVNEGCTTFQGFYLSHPLLPEEFIRFSNQLKRKPFKLY